MAIARVDILDPNDFSKTGEVKTIHEAWAAGDWIGSFNLWVVQDQNEGSILYQQRSFSAQWAPGLLDVSAGGHYDAGESVCDGIREVREELGKAYCFSDLRNLGRRVYLRNDGGRKLRYVVDVFIIVDNSPLDTFILQAAELEGLYRCPISELMKAHTNPTYSFVAEGMRCTKSSQSPSTLMVSQASLPFNWDNYHYKMTLLAKRLLEHPEDTLIY